MKSFRIRGIVGTSGRQRPSRRRPLRTLRYMLVPSREEPRTICHQGRQSQSVDRGCHLGRCTNQQMLWRRRAFQALCLVRLRTRGRWQYRA